MQPLTSREVSRRCDLGALAFETTDELPDLDEALGQERAVEALRLGVDIRAHDFNVFAFGPMGVGKRALIRGVVAAKAQAEPAPADWCYVGNFDDPRRPLCLSLPPGRGARFRDGVEALVEDAIAAIRTALESTEFDARKSTIEASVQRPHDAALAKLAQDAQAKGLSLVVTPEGAGLVPTKDGKTLEPDAVAQLPEAEHRALQEAIEQLESVLDGILRETAIRARGLRAEIEALATEAATAGCAQAFAEARRDHADVPAAAEHLEAIHADLVEQLVAYALSPASEEDGDPDPLDLSGRYRVNLLVSHAPAGGAPVVYEDHPTHGNLLGRVEHTTVSGTLITHHGLIRAGALHRANGGYLIVDASRLLRDPSVYDALKRMLRARQIRLEPPGDMAGTISTELLEPEPIPLSVRVVMIGDHGLYQRLRALDPDFSDLFKVAAEFDDQVAWDVATTPRYARLVATLARRHGLLPLDRGAVARTMEHAARAAGHQAELSLELRDLGDLLREADHVARAAHLPRIGPAQIEAALAARVRRVDRLRDRALESIARGQILIDLGGSRAGQVNALAAFDLGGFVFGLPARVTARVHLGRGQVIDVERRAHLGGPIHSKGVLILSSFLASRYAPDRPLSLSASLVFEQSYSGIDGDSASSAELCALLSALADLPLDQSMALTGSVDQAGRVQAIGAVNEKVEGFFDVCQRLGPAPGQGVIIPHANTQNLLLRPDVVRAIEEDRFRVWAVSTVDEAMELLTGHPAGARTTAGAFPAGSINQRVEGRLIALADQASRRSTRR